MERWVLEERMIKYDKDGTGLESYLTTASNLLKNPKITAVWFYRTLLNKMIRTRYINGATTASTNKQTNNHSPVFKALLAA